MTFVASVALLQMSLSGRWNQSYGLCSPLKDVAGSSCAASNQALCLPLPEMGNIQTRNKILQGKGKLAGICQLVLLFKG